jgi:hypothetical protein
MILDDTADLQAEWKLGFGYHTSNPLNVFSFDTSLSPPAHNSQAMPLLDLPDFDSMELLADPPNLDVAILESVNVPFSVSSLNDFSASRLLYAIDLIKQAPSAMVQENQTPWSHQRLYDDAMPRVLSGRLWP